MGMGIFLLNILPTFLLNMVIYHGYTIYDVLELVYC